MPGWCMMCVPDPGGYKHARNCKYEYAFQMARWPGHRIDISMLRWTARTCVANAPTDWGNFYCGTAQRGPCFPSTWLARASLAGCSPLTSLHQVHRGRRATCTIPYSL